MLKIAALIAASAAGSLAAASLASAATTSSDAMLVANAPWWETVTVTMTGDGDAQSCAYKTSLRPNATEHCDVASQAAEATEAAAHHDGSVTRITFERRFSPGAAPAKPALAKGDTLLGGQIMALNIDKLGKVKGCRIVAQSGSMQPQYGCADAAAERFQASLGSTPAPEQQGYMTVTVYGHSEHMV